MSSLPLSHYSIDRVTSVRDGDPHTERGAYKPTGFWLSVDGEDDWREWCERNDFLPRVPVLRHRVTLKPDARVLHIDSAGGLLDFSSRFRSQGHRYDGILWPTVALQYDGVIVAPYQWSLRMADETHWYYGWDCASGVIWKARAIASVEVVGEVEFKSRSDAEAA